MSGPLLKRLLKAGVKRRDLARIAGTGVVVGTSSKYGTGGVGPQASFGKRKASNSGGPAKRPRLNRKKFKVSDYTRSFKSGKRPMVSKYVQKHFDDYGTIERNHSMWLCNQTHGSRERIIQLAAEALLRALLSRIDVYPNVHDQTMSEHFVSVEIRWRRISINGSPIDTDKEYNVGGNDSFYGIAKLIGDDWASTSTSTTELGTPVRAIFRRLENIGGGATSRQAFRTVEDLERMKLNLFVTTKLKLQNITPADDGSVNLDRVSTNPLSGKIYEFTTQPRVPERVLLTHSGTSGLQDFLDPTGIFALTDRAETGTDGIMGHPPPAAGLFNNCRKVASVSMAAGGMKHKNASFTFSGTVFRFTQLFVLGLDTGSNSGQARRFGGGTYWVALEQAFRQGPDIIKIGFNREVVMHGRAEFAKRRSMLRHYEQTDLGDTY